MILASTPRLVVFQLLEHCNLRCTMCYEWGEAGSYLASHASARLDLAVVRRIIDELAVTRPSFEFFGGEPLLYKDLFHVIRAIRDAGCTVSFSTNGTLLERLAERLVADAPHRIWVSLDGPEAINDLQRGRGVFRRAMAGIARVQAIKRAVGTVLPELGITYVVTPDNHAFVEEFFATEIDLASLNCVSVEMQSFATQMQIDDYAGVLRDRFDVNGAPSAQGFVRDPRHFSCIDVHALSQQLASVEKACHEAGVAFNCQPEAHDPQALADYFAGRWLDRPDARRRCGVPWVSCEINARGEVSTCHAFHDVSIGNVYCQSLLDIWKGERARQVRDHLRDQLFPICTACCRYYSGAGALSAPGPAS